LVSKNTVRFLISLPLALLALVALFFMLRPDSRGHSSTRSPAAAADEARDETFDLAIRGGTMTPNEIAVEEGDRVTLRINSDHTLELHVHGYDLEGETGPGKPAKLSFDATITGRFEIENHHNDSVLGVLLVRPR
jgi:hypothetical protein